MPYTELGRIKKSTYQERGNDSIAVFLVGGPNSLAWYGTSHGSGMFIQELLEIYDVVYIPSYYGTSGRSKAQGSIVKAASNELDFFLDFISSKNTSSLDILSISGGGFVSVLLSNPRITKKVIINPPLVSMKRLYWLRKEEVFYGSKKHRAFKALITVGMGDIDTMEPQNKTYFVEKNADHVTRYFGQFFEKSIFDFLSDSESTNPNCLHFLIGDKDDTIGYKAKYIKNTPYNISFLKNVNHDFTDTETERNIVTTKVTSILKKSRSVGLPERCHS